VCLLLLSGLVLLTGCSGSKGDANAVSGKVTMGGKAVSGIVTFVYADNKELSAPTGDGGKYTIIKTTPGQVKILVKAMPGAVVRGEPAKEVSMKDAPPSLAPAGDPPPAKYGAVATSDLTYEVKAGKQTHDIELSP